ncbi:hypothetical protein B0F90DRAFT_1756463 [Multifurca ochricompacta]|uniref:RING-type domain-containing protein n=1 Tax=Multifurca ochricompacta TaxID=376703 RepID=A0AAD4LYE2_9AGAM|nr:hypothetical protein B0F90DRAFT_1756463 [Multifurca ochricompacta]
MALRNATRDEDDLPAVGKGKARARAAVEQCPVCMQDVEGDPDVIEAHINACLAHIELRQPGGSTDDDVSVDADTPLDVRSETPDGVRRLRLRAGARARVGAAALGFAVGDRTVEDVEDEIDVEGDDLGAFGAAQFTEADVLAEGSRDSQPFGLNTSSRRDAEIGADLAIERARHGKDPQALISALESKVQLLTIVPSEGAALGCRICLESYSEPTVSTGCWHACCRECWLLCLNATGVCPICKRITVASDLRRVYL